MWDLSSLTRDRTHTPCIGRQSLNHWTTREVHKIQDYCVLSLFLLCIDSIRIYSVSTMLAPWKKSYDKPRQHIKKERHHCDDKDLYSQSYGFPSSHVWM